jgi:hypothetical protein
MALSPRSDLEGRRLRFLAQMERCLPLRLAFSDPWQKLYEVVAEMPRVFAEEAADALQNDDVKRVNHYLGTLLELPLDHDTYCAFFAVVSQPAWRKEKSALSAYLASAVRKERRREIRDREKPERIRQENHEVPIPAEELAFRGPTSELGGDPLRQLILKQEFDRFAGELPVDQRELLIALLQEKPAEALKARGYEWPMYQNVKRKGRTRFGDLL